MNVLIVGSRSKLVINYLNYIVSKQMEAIDYLGLMLPKVNYICIDEVDKDEEIRLNESNSNFKYYKLELNKENIDYLIKKYNINRVINFHEVTNTTKEEYTKHNFDFVIDLYHCCEENNVEHITHISSALVYGSSKQVYCTEKSQLKATDDYTDSKINADLFLLSQSNVKTAILRVAEVFGPIYRNTLLDNIIVSILEDKDIIIEEDIDFVRSYIYVQDCIYFVTNSSMNKVNGVYNVCSELHISAKEMIIRMTELFNYTHRIKYVKTKKVSLEKSKVTGNAISELLNYTLTRQRDKFAFFVNEIRYEHLLYKQIKNTTK